MYNLQLNIDRIVSLTQSKDLSINKMLKNAGLAPSIIDNMKRGRLPSIDKIYDIADYFDCSVDYLLGRTDNPNKQKSSNDFSGSSITNSNIANNSANITIKNENNLTDEESELINIYRTLNVKKRHQVLDLVFKLENEMKEINNVQ